MFDPQFVNLFLCCIWLSHMPLDTFATKVILKTSEVQNMDFFCEV